MVDDVAHQDVIEARVREGQRLGRGRDEAAAREHPPGELQLGLEEVDADGAVRGPEVDQGGALPAAEVEDARAEREERGAHQLALAIGDEGARRLPGQVLRRGVAERRAQVVRGVHSPIRSLRKPNAVILRSSQPWAKRLILVSP